MTTEYRVVTDACDLFSVRIVPKSGVLGLTERPHLASPQSLDLETLREALLRMYAATYEPVLRIEPARLVECK